MAEEITTTTAAAVPSARMRLAALARENKKTRAARERVVRQFLEFLGSRPASPEMLIEFLTKNIEDGYAASTMWTRRSLLETHYTTMVDPPLDFSTVDPLLDKAFKRLSREHVARHAREFTSAQLFDFWARAPDEGEWLFAKAVSLVGFFGCARNGEMVKLTWADVEDAPPGVWVTLHWEKCANDGKDDRILIPRVMPNGQHRIVPAEKFLEYRRQVLAAPPEKGNRVWRRWANGKWVAQAVGEHSMQHVPQKVATFLGLDPTGFRGHSWRPSGATALAAHGGTAAQLQVAGHWASLGVAQQYIHAGDASKIDIASVLAGPGSQEDSSSPQTAPQQAASQPQEPPAKIPKVIFTAPLTNCTINIYAAH